MKTIRLFLVHKLFGGNLEEALHFLCLDSLKDRYNFIYTDDHPDYLFISEHLYMFEESAVQLQKLYKDAKVRIFFAGEAVTPDFNLVDYAVGYDEDLKMGNRFCQLPPPDVVPGGDFVKDEKNSIQTIEQAQEELNRKKGFCNFLYSNGNAHPMRDKIFYAVSSYKRVDSLGKHLNNVNSAGTGYVGHSMECVPLKSLYKFSISCENACVPGYTSEKILTSLEAHTVPIYWGDPCIEKHINPECFINANKYSSLEDLVNRVREIDNNDKIWCRMISAPWRTPEQEDYRAKRKLNYIEFICGILDKSIESASVLPEGTHPNMYRSRYMYMLGCWHKPTLLGKVKNALLGWSY